MAPRTKNYRPRQGPRPTLLLLPGDLNVHVPGNYERHSYETGQAKVHGYKKYLDGLISLHTYSSI
jgi:hypothetical protein